MNRILILGVFLIPATLLAAFSEFVVVKPNSGYAYDFDFKISHPENRGKCTIEFNAVGYDHKHAWLVVSTRVLSKKEQELRGYLSGCSPKPITIEMMSKLKPIRTKAGTDANDVSLKYKITLNSEMALRSYVYIDFPNPNLVLDGGYYYSIPLGDYCG